MLEIKTDAHHDRNISGYSGNPDLGTPIQGEKVDLTHVNRPDVSDIVPTYLGN